MACKREAQSVRISLPDAAVVAHRETTAAPERATASGGETTARTELRAAWDYVALGDSLAAGVGARRG